MSRAQSYFPLPGTLPYEPTVEEIYGRLTLEIQARWTDTERASRGRMTGSRVGRAVGLDSDCGLRAIDDRALERAANRPKHE